MYETIASPIEYGGIRLKNRIIFAPTTMGLKQEDDCEKNRQNAGFYSKYIERIIHS